LCLIDRKFLRQRLHDDYAISETLFHWQSQNSSRPDIGKGKRHIIIQKILLFVRKKQNDKKDNTMGYVFFCWRRGNFKEMKVHQ